MTTTRGDLRPEACADLRQDGPRDARGATRHGAPALARPVVLVGLMGAGKTSVGMRLAHLLGAGFVDSDDEIEKAANLSVPEIFERYGEAHFRAGERRVLARILDGRPAVVATGGGAFMDAETRALVHANAVSVWLRATLDVLVQRTSGRGHRPLLNRGNPREILCKLIDQRYPVYADADITVDSLAEQSHDQMAARIVEALLTDGRAFVTSGMAAGVAAGTAAAGTAAARTTAARTAAADAADGPTPDTPPDAALDDASASEEK